jgi:hypothetical protein
MGSNFTTPLATATSGMAISTNLATNSSIDSLSFQEEDELLEKLESGTITHEELVRLYCLRDIHWKLDPAKQLTCSYDKLRRYVSDHTRLSCLWYICEQCKRNMQGNSPKGSTCEDFYNACTMEELDALGY